ncbi:DUF4224 domain-containing protein [Alloalcanivorax sp. C16-1]|uniref:DUF4224 domain-containing protein n=1 Tax=Alloalcanivorax sp. C16-1 TaxID=3390051 RepID=UPI0039709787
MGERVITEEELLEDTGFARRGDLRRWLDQENIPYRVGRGGRICGVTVDAYGAAANDPRGIEFADGP